MKTPEDEKEALEKKIAKLQAKYMEQYGETPEEDSNEEVEQNLNQPIEVANWILENNRQTIR